MSETESKDGGESRSNDSRPEPRQRQQRHPQVEAGNQASDNDGGTSSENGEQRAEGGDNNQRQQRHEGRRDRGQRPQRGPRHHHPQGQAAQ